MNDLRAKIDQNGTNLVSSRWYYWFLAIISFVFVLLFSRATSPLYAYVGYDAAIFKQMGMAILKGKTIYLDYFDNKGCLLYFIHALCLWLGGDFIILIFQAISLTITLILLDKIISLYKEGASRLYVLLAGLLLLLCFYEGGDLTEEWSLPFICYPLYKFLKLYKEDKSLIAKDLYFIGLCFGVIAFLRINNAAPFCGFLLCLFVGYLLKKQWKDFIIKALAFIGGVLTISIPCFLYFYMKAGTEGVYWMVYGTFLSGFRYIGVDVKVSVIVIITYYLIISVLLFVQILSLKNQSALLVPIIISYLLFLLAFGTKCFEHYQMIMIPLYVICILTYNEKYKIVKKVVSTLFIIIITVYFVRPMGFLVLEAFGEDKIGEMYAGFHNIITNIPESERDSIYNYNTDGMGCGLLYHEGLLQCNKVLFTSLSFWIKELYEERKPLEKDKPLWIMIYHGAARNEDMLYLRDYYDELYVFHYDNEHFNNNKLFGIKKDIYFFRRK